MHLSSQLKHSLDTGFFAAFGAAPQRYFSAPGRTEIGGNHTDHQHGRVLAAAPAWCCRFARKAVLT